MREFAVEFGVSALQEVYFRVEQLWIEFRVVVPVNTSHVRIKYRRPPLGELAVEYDDSALHHQLFNPLGVGEEVLMDSFLGVQVDSTMDVSSLVFVIKSAINHNKVRFFARI